MDSQSKDTVQKKKKHVTKLRTQDQMASQIGAERARTQREGRGASDRWGGGGWGMRRGKSSGETWWGATVRGGSPCQRLSHSKADVLSRRLMTARSQPAAELCMTRSRHETSTCKPNEWEIYIEIYIYIPSNGRKSATRFGLRRRGRRSGERRKAERWHFHHPPLPPSHLPPTSPNF